MLTAALALVVMPAEIEVPATVARLGALLPSLSQTSGRKLVAASNVDEDVIGIASPKRPIEEIMALIAKAANATWSEEAGSWVLRRTPAQGAADQEEDIAARMAWMKRALAQIPLDEPFDQAKAVGLANYRYEFKSRRDLSDGEYAQLDGLNAKSPLGRLTRRLLEALGLQTLARLPQGRRTVYSTRPTPMQRRLDPEQIRSAVESYVSEQSLYAEAVQARGTPKTGESSTFVSGFDHVAIPPKAWDRTLIILDTTNPYQLFAYLVLADARGDILTTVRCFLNRSWAAADPVPAEPGSPVIELPEEVYALAARNETGESATPEQRAFFASPWERDPLAWVHKESLGAWSAWKRVPIVALLPDSLLLSYGIKKPFSVAAYRARLGPLKIDETPAGVVIRPTMPYAAHVERLSRRALQALVSAQARDGYLSMAALLDYVASSPNSGEGITYLATGERLNLESKNPVKIVAIASAEVRSGLLAGGRLTVRAMNPQQRELATNAFYSPRLDLIDIPNSERNLRYEPTEAFPNGLPPEAALVSSFSEGLAIGLDDPRFGKLFLPPGQIAWYIKGAGGPDNLLFSYGRRQALSLHLEVGDRRQDAPPFVAKIVEKRGAAVKMKDLPDAHRTALEEALAKL